MRPLLVLAALPLLVPQPTLANADWPGLKADQIGTVFCLSRTGSDEALIAGILTPELSAVIADAQKRSDDWAKAHPDEKPPLGDGIGWQSAPDYAASCKVGLVTLMKTDARVDLRYDFPDAPDAGFTDTLILKRVDNPALGTSAWRIDNVLYPDGTDLRAGLVAAFEGYQ